MNYCIVMIMEVGVATCVLVIALPVTYVSHHADMRGPSFKLDWKKIFHFHLGYLSFAFFMNIVHT